MSFGIYDATIPVYKQGLATLLHLLDKAEEHATANNVDINTLIEGKLAPDMFNFKQQIQIACDMAKGGAMRLTGQDVPSHPDTETTVTELRTRIQMVLTIINSVTVEQCVGAEERDIKMVFPSKTFEFKGSRFVTYWSLPNFFFHVTTAYNILRHQGVVIGKPDFLGQ
ncbi:MAG TPA: DUF1993 domain-containing protein [Pseudomonadales bacterium]|nr:DUF1993 domain-containing protein [Pseudomonadales bacterium]